MFLWGCLDFLCGVNFLPKRISQHSIDKNGAGRGVKFKPDLEEWRLACRIFPTDKAIYKSFGVSCETFYAFLDRERYNQEQSGNKSAFVEAYKQERWNTRKRIADSYFANLKEGEVAASIFGMKAFNGWMEASETAKVELKKLELELKRKNYLTSLAEKFQLNVEELQAFTDKHFKSVELD